MIVGAAEGSSIRGVLHLLTDHWWMVFVLTDGVVCLLQLSLMPSLKVVKWLCRIRNRQFERRLADRVPPACTTEVQPGHWTACTPIDRHRIVLQDGQRFFQQSAASIGDPAGATVHKYI